MKNVKLEARLPSGLVVSYYEYQ